MGAIHEQSFKHNLAEQNYYIVAPESVARDSLIKDRLAQMGVKYVDREALHGVVTKALLEPHDGWDDITPDADLLAAGSEDEASRISIEISKRRKFIVAALGKTSFSTDQIGKINYQGEIIEPTADSALLAPVLERSKTVHDQIWSWINAQANDNGGVLVLGDTPEKVDSTKFQILRPELPENIGHAVITPELVDQYSGRLVQQAAKKLLSQRRVSKEQSAIGMPRSEFTWTGNDLIGQVRNLCAGTMSEVCREFSANGVTEFDVAAQVMMHLPTHAPTELWQGEDDTVQAVCELLNNDRGDDANTLLSNALNRGELTLNVDLINSEIYRHAQKTATHYNGLHVELDNGTKVYLPAAYMGDPEKNPFKNVERAEINAQDRKVHDANTPEESMEVIEKHTGKRIIFKPIPAEISKLYSLGFSNLHYARDGEIGAFGAFLEDDDLPFAYSSYSPVTRQYAKDMLEYLEIDPAAIVESTRAWNAPWAPENTMSTLFSYAHSMLKAERARGIASGNYERELAGVVTSINPNLGFKAVSFRGVRFNVAGVKPTGFTYLSNEDGSADFMPSSEIKKALGLEDSENTEDHPRFLSPQIPLLSTLEFIALFNNGAEKRLLSKPIYRITPAAAKRA